MFFYRILITTITLLCMGFFSADIALVSATESTKVTSKDTSSASGSSKKIKENTIKNETSSEDEGTNIEKLRQDINESIVDFIVVPKARQLIKDITTKFTDEYPNPEDRIIAYEAIKKRLILRKNRVELMKMSEKGKFILQEFLDQMIELLDRRIDELR